jgi:hypothetical protein
MAKTRVRNSVLPDNPLHQFTSYSTYYTIKIGRNYSGKKAGTNIVPGGQDNEENILLVDTRGKSQGGNQNRHGELNVTYFDIMHFFAHGPEATFGLDSTLKIFERGGAAYMQILGEIMLELEVSSVAELVLWVGVGIYGWVDTNLTLGTFEATPVAQRWFPMKMVKIDMELTAGGTEYVHWLTGWPYFGSNDRSRQQINNIGTCGRTVNDHLIQLMEFATQKAVDTKNEQIENTENTTNDNPVVFKTVTYGFDFETGIDGSKIERAAVVESDVTTQNTGGVVNIYSGGQTGETTIITHISKILEHCPAINASLKKKNQWYKIVPRTDMTEEFEDITYTIIPYQLDSRGLLPLKRFNYFFGGTNEDVIEFSFSLDGLFIVLGQSTINGTRNSVETNNDEGATKAEGNKEKSENIKVIDDPNIPKTAQDKVSPSNRRNQRGRGMYAPLKNKGRGAYRNISSKAQNVQLNLMDNVETFVGNKILEGGFTIVGDPNLILDEKTIVELEKAGAPFEKAINYITFDIGTPNPEFPDIPSTDNFIFSGYYGIRTLKSVWQEDGTFTQEITVFWRADLSSIAGGGKESKAPDFDIDLETLGE